MCYITLSCGEAETCARLLSRILVLSRLYITVTLSVTLSSMQFFAKLTLAAAAAASILGVVARPMNTTIETRGAAKVITKCTVPNTAALT